MTESCPLDSAVGARASTFRNRTEYREVLGRPHKGEIHRTPDGRSWIAVHEHVMAGEIVHTRSKMLWKLVEVIQASHFTGAAISCIDGSDLDGIHLLWNSSYRGGHSFQGYDIWRRKSKYHLEIICFDLNSDELNQLHTLFRLERPPTIISLRAGEMPQHYDTIPGQTIPGPSTREKSSVRGEPAHRRSASEDMEVMPHEGPSSVERLTNFLALLEQSATLASTIPILISATLATGCLVYEIAFERPRLMIAVRIGSSGGFAIGLRNDKTVVTEPLAPKGNASEAAFGMHRVDRVLLYVFQKATSLRVCYGDEISKAEQAGWQHADLVAQGIQLPFRRVNPRLSGFKDELDLANSRLTGADSFRPEGFRELSDLMNATAKAAGGVSPAYLSAQIRGKAQDPFVEIWPWQYGMGLNLSHVGRRVLGFSFLDRGENLIEGDVYDYRILGYVRRGDTQEKFYGFHTIPADSMLPDVFYLGPIRFASSSPLGIEPFPPAPAGALRHIARKGLRIETSVNIHFPQPLRRIVLELEPFANHNLNYEARPSAWNSIIPFHIYHGPVPKRHRVELDFPTPIDRLELEGFGFLYGLRISPLTAGDDPEEVVEIDTTIYGVRYEPTPPPDPPTVLGTTNLQEAPKQGKPEEMAKELIYDLGFHLYWLPPGTLPVWPPDLANRPKLDVPIFEIERRQLDLDAGFQPIEVDEEWNLPTIVGGNRSSRADPRPLFRGADLLELYPEEQAPTPPVPVWMEVDDVLRSPGKPNGPDPGTCHQYRIYSIDPIGRRSPVPTEGPVIMLEKHRPPPQPPGPVPPLAPPAQERARPRGVRARVIQASDPLLTLEDEELLQGHSNAIVLEWGWTRQERDADPFAREFRVYFRSKPPDIVSGTLTGKATWNGSTYEMQATVDRGVMADRMTGQYMLAGSYPFRIASHTGAVAGGTLEVRFEPSRIKPAQLPEPASFVMMLAPTEGDFRPDRWDERKWVEPITIAINYSHVLYDHLFPSAETPLARAWVGVSAADDQYYVDDEVPAGKANSGRPGNESSIAAVPLVARYFGQPTLQDKPLWEVPTVLLDEVEGETVSHIIDLPSLLQLPAQQQFLIERICASDIVAMLGKTADGRISFTTPDGKDHYFRYGENPAEPGTTNDQAELLQAISTGEPVRIANKFLMDLLSRFAGEDLSRLWNTVPGTPGPLIQSGDSVPNKPERYIYKARLVDAAGNVSEGAVLVPAVFRVPSRRSPAQPDIGKLVRNEDQVLGHIEMADAFDMVGVLLFYHVSEAAGGPGSVLERKPRLLRVPNRPDLYPLEGIRVRLSDGSWAKHVFLPKTAAAQDASAPGVLKFSASIPAGFDHQVAVWAAAITRDGIPSLLAGPRFTTTPSAPPLVPALSVNPEPQRDKVSWAGPEPGTLLAIERSTDGQVWRRISPWLEAHSQITEYDAVAPPAGHRWYRLRVRKPGREMDTTGRAVDLQV